MEKVGSKVRVKAPLKVYHVAKLPDLELTPDMVGVIKQYVGFWKGKRISPNYPFKVQFLVDHPTTGTPVKFVAHLKEDEFQIIH
ncbi:Ferredoxin-thioredoxin reductase variable chain chloroplastic [Bienertia sinuspersici]